LTTFLIDSCFEMSGPLFGTPNKKFLGPIQKKIPVPKNP